MLVKNIHQCTQNRNHKISVQRLLLKRAINDRMVHLSKKQTIHVQKPHWQTVKFYLATLDRCLATMDWISMISRVDELNRMACSPCMVLHSSAGKSTAVQTPKTLFVLGYFVSFKWNREVSPRTNWSFEVNLRSFYFFVMISFSSRS